MPRLPHRPVTSALLGLGLVIGAATTTAGAVPAFAVSTAPAATSGSVVAESTSAPLSAITAGGITALAKAQAAVAGAAKVSMDITASGLDVGRTDIVIDTTKLSALVDKLQALEVTPAMMYRWSVRGYERTLMPGAQLGHTHIPGWFQHDPAIRLWLDAFLDHWLKEPAEAGTTSP